MHVIAITIPLKDEELESTNDNQQVAEAMVQLSGAGFYTQQQQEAEDSMDLDPNYDPSDFLNLHKAQQLQSEPPIEQIAEINELPNTNQATMLGQNEPLRQLRSFLRHLNNDDVGIHEDLAISDSSEDEDGPTQIKTEQQRNDNGSSDDEMNSSVDPNFIMEVDKDDSDTHNWMSMQ